MIAGALEVQLMADVARIRDDMQKATGFVTSGAKNMERAAAGVKAALGGIVAGLTVAAFAGWIRGAINAADAASKLSQKIGVATQDIAGLQLAYKLSGAGAEAMQTSISKLSKGLIENNKGLEALGIKTKDAGGAFRSTKAVLHDVADQIQKMPDGLQKTAIAVEIFGKAGANMIPLLNGGAQGMRDMDEMARKLGLTISGETGKQAEAFNDTLAMIGMGSRGVANGLMAQLLPTLTSLAASFLESMTSGDKLARTADVLGTAMRGLYSIGVGIVELFSTVGKVLGGVGGGVGLILRGEFALGAGVIKEMLADVGQGWKDTAQQIRRAWTDQGNAAVEATARMMAGQKDLLGAAKAREEANKKAAAAALKEAEAYDKLILALSGKENGVNPDFLEKMKLLIAQGKLRNVDMTETVRLQNLLISQQPYMVKQEKEALDAAKERQKLRQQEADSIAAFMREESARQASAVKGARDALQAAKDELANRGRLKSAIEATNIARLREQLTTKTAGTEAYEALVREIETRKELIGVLKDTELAEASEKAATAAKEQWKQVSDSFVDNLMRGGKSVAQYLKDLFRTLVLRPLLQPVGNMMAQGVNGVMGMAGGGVGGTGMLGGLGNAASMYGGLSSIGSAFMGGYSGIAGLGAATTAMGATSTMSAVGAGAMLATDAMGATVAAGAAGATGAGGIMAGASAALGAIPVAGWIALAAIALYSAFGNKGGGPKTESGFTPSLGLDGYSGFDGSEYQRDQAGAKTISAGISDSYALLSKQLGLTNNKLDVALFYAMDNAEGGTAKTLLQVASANYNRGDRLGGVENVERGEEALKAAIAEETIRVIFEALKASDLSDQYKAWLNAVTGDSVAEMQAAIDRVTRVSAEKQTLEAILFDLTATDLEKLNKARDAERAAVDESNRALLEQIYAQQDLKAAMDATVDSTRDQMDIAKAVAGSYVEYMRLMGRINAGIPITGGRLPGYADGGTASGWSMVGERGPEIVDFSQPGQVYTAEQTRGMFSGGSDLAPLLAEVRDELRAIRTEDGARGDVIKGASLKTAEVLTYIKTNGMPLGEDLLAGG